MNKSQARLVLAAAAYVTGASCASSPTEPLPSHPPGTAVAAAFLGHGPWGAAISRSGKGYVTRPLTDSIAVISVNGGTPAVVKSFKVGIRPDEVVFHSSGSAAYVTNIDSRTVGVINTAADSQIKAFAMPAAPIRIALGPGETSLYVTMDNGVLAVIDPVSGALIKPIPVGGFANGIALHSAGSRIFVSLMVAGKIVEINTATNSITREFIVGGVPQDLVVAPDRNALYLANEDGWVDVRDLTTGARIDSIPMPKAFRLALTPDGKQLWVSQSGLARISVINLDTPQSVTVVPTLGTPRHIAFPRSGEYALVANEAGFVQIVR